MQQKFKDMIDAHVASAARCIVYATMQRINRLLIPQPLRVLNSSSSIACSFLLVAIDVLEQKVCRRCAAKEVSHPTDGTSAKQQRPRAGFMAHGG
jgi:hypothetical protein